MKVAARHSRGNAKHWFRYLCKYIHKCGVVFTHADIDTLCDSDVLSLFQRVTLKAAFKDDSLTRQYIIAMNQPATLDMVTRVRARLMEGKQ